MLHLVFTKRILPVIILFLAISFSGFANMPFNKGEVEKYRGTEWKLYKEVDGLQIFFKFEERHDLKHGIHKEYLLIRFNNTTNNNLEINWKDEIWYDEKCVSCQSSNNEFNKKITINSGQSFEGDCNANILPELKIHSKFLNYDLEELTNYEMTDLKVSQLN